MNFGQRKMLTVAGMALGLCLSGVAGAQTAEFKIPTKLSYASTDRQTWNTVLLISGIVAIVGLTQSDSTLTILGGAGVLVSLVQLNKNGYMPQYSPRGLDFYKSGPVSFGFNPFGMVGPNQDLKGIRPSGYITANFKF